MIDFPNSPTVGQIFSSGTQSWQWDGVKWVAFGTAAGAGAPNKLVNPFMEIDQANEGAAITASGYIIDGTQLVTASVGTITGQRVADAPTGYLNSVRITCTVAAAVTSSTAVLVLRRLEGDDLIDTGFGTANAQSLSLAFWLKASIAGVYSVSLRNSNAYTRSLVFPVTINAANTWQFFTQTIPGDMTGTWVTSGNAAGLDLNFSAITGSGAQTSTYNVWQAGAFTGAASALNNFSNTTSATFQLGPCGLWAAPAPQPLLRTSIQAELARCQRYYEKSYDLGTTLGTVTNSGMSAITAGTAPTATQQTVTFKVSKRADGTGTFYSPGTGAVGKARDFSNSVDLNPTIVSNGMSSFSWYSTPATGGPNLGMHWAVDARL